MSNLEVPGSVLVVDDDADIRKLLAGLLVEFAVEDVPTVSDAWSVLDRDVEDAPTVVILDLVLDQHDGRELLDHVKIRSGQTQPIIITGAVSLPQDEQMMLAYRDVPILQKPFSIPQVTAAVWAKSQRAKERRLLGELSSVLGQISRGDVMQQELAKARRVFSEGSARKSS